MSHLLPCPACNRHIDAVESVCPFCAAPVTDIFGAARPRAMPPRRLGRAALMAAGATLMGVGACSGNDSIGAPKDASTVSTGTGGNALPAYGTPPHPGTGGSTGSGGNVVAAYGGPIPTGGTSGSGGGPGGGSGATGGASGSTTDGAAPDGASDAGGASGRDAAPDRTIIAIYGAPDPAGSSK